MLGVVRVGIGGSAGGCKRWVSLENYARHVKTCGRVEVRGAVGGWDVEVGIRGGEQVRMVTCGGAGGR